MTIRKQTIPQSPPPPRSPSSLLSLPLHFTPNLRRRKSGNLCASHVHFRDASIHLWCHRHDPDAEDAVVMITPSKDHEVKFNPKFVFSRA